MYTKTMLSIGSVTAVFFVAGSLSLSSMASSGFARQAVNETMISQQLMIKFRPNTVSCDIAGIAKFSETIKLQLEFIRPMSGNACVIKLFAAQASGFEYGLQLLRTYSEVEWVALDNRKKIL